MPLDIPASIYWPNTVEEALAIQQELRKEVIIADQIGEVRYVAGVDVGFEQDGTVTRAAVAVLTFPGLQVVETYLAKQTPGSRTCRACCRSAKFRPCWRPCPT
jgi:deoxyribonuclease V